MTQEELATLEAIDFSHHLEDSDSEGELESWAVIPPPEGWT